MELVGIDAAMVETINTVDVATPIDICVDDIVAIVAVELLAAGGKPVSVRVISAGTKTLTISRSAGKGSKT